MKKSDLIKALSDKENLAEIRATEIVNLIFDGFTEALKTDRRIESRGFASFSVRRYKAYSGRNPKTGGKIQVKPKRLPFLKVGKELRKMVDGA